MEYVLVKTLFRRVASITSPLVANGISVSFFLELSLPFVEFVFAPYSNVLA